LLCTYLGWKTARDSGFALRATSPDSQAIFLAQSRQFFTWVKTSVAITDILSEGLIKIGMEAIDKDEAIAELLEVLVRAGRVKDRNAAMNAILRREAQGSTGIGGGIGIPHGKDQSIERLAVAIGTSPDGIEFDALDNQPVNVVFMVLAEGNNPGPHVQLLSELAVLLQTPNFKERLIAARNPAEALQIVREAEEYEA